MSQYTAKVQAWKQENSLDNLAPNGRIHGDYEVLTKRVLDGFKDFFTKDGHTTDFRACMNSWKKYVAGHEKDKKAWERAVAKGSAARSRLIGGTDNADEKPTFIESAEKLINDMGENFAGENCSTSVADFPRKVWQSSTFSSKLEDLGKSQSFVTQVKWLKTRCAKDGQDFMVSEVTNKKLYGEIVALFGKVDSSVARDDKSFLVKFPQEHESLKKAVVDFQVAAICEGYYNIGVTPFCLPEVRAVLDGDHFLVGIAQGALKGETMQAKLETFGSSTWQELQAVVVESGFACRVKQGQVVAIPAGMIVATIGPTDGHSIMVRWSILRAGDLDPSMSLMQLMLHAYSYLQSTDYATLHKLMQASVRPAGAISAASPRQVS